MHRSCNFWISTVHLFLNWFIDSHLLYKSAFKKIVIVIRHGKVSHWFIWSIRQQEAKSLDISL